MARTPDITVPDLTGRRVVVTGAGDGIGLGIARRLAASGAEVIAPVRNPPRWTARPSRAPLNRVGRGDGFSRWCPCSDR
jgi:NAD(P)-dependent dehydrogenase (short-subunit alcohol dehydrogenase family)